MGGVLPSFENSWILRHGQRVESNRARSNAASARDPRHDRAAFHFLTNEEDVQLYLDRINSHLLPGGHLVIGTFSEAGPQKCSGIRIQQYSENTMSILLEELFDKIKCLYVDHITPSKTIQNFLFCCFQSNKQLI